MGMGSPCFRVLRFISNLWVLEETLEMLTAGIELGHAKPYPGNPPKTPGQTPLLLWTCSHNSMAPPFREQQDISLWDDRGNSGA